MDYEQKYKDALERARGFYIEQNQDPAIITKLEHLFPELKESEDERIVKKVINVLKLNINGAESQMQASKDVDRTFEIYACNKVIAWLEKQKPVKWHIEDEQNLNAVLSYIEDEYLRRWLKDTIHVIYDKPVEWSEKDDSLFNFTIESLEELLEIKFDIPDREYTSPEGKRKILGYISENIEWLKSLKQRIKGE